MYTEIEISEFTIRARLKLGNLSQEIAEKQEHGIDATSLIEDSAFIRLFLNSINSVHNDWTDLEKLRRTEYLAETYSLVDKPIYTKDWLDKFKSPSTIIRTGETVVNMPESGEGYAYINNGIIELRGDTSFSLSDLPKA